MPSDETGSFPWTEEEAIEMTRAFLDALAASRPGSTIPICAYMDGNGVIHEGVAGDTPEEELQVLTLLEEGRRRIEGGDG